jgi:hypothetical protein
MGKVGLYQGARGPRLVSWSIERARETVNVPYGCPSLF